jgi:hypothetical protein
VIFWRAKYATTMIKPKIISVMIMALIVKFGFCIFKSGALTGSDK